MKLNRISIATSVASNDPAPAAQPGATHADWKPAINRAEHPHAIALQRTLASNKPYRARVPYLGQVKEELPIASRKKRFLFGVSALLGVAAIPIAISGIAIGPIALGVAVGCIFGAAILHKIAKRMS